MKWRDHFNIESPIPTAMDSRIENQFSASHSAIGYLYQCRLALLEALKRLKPGHSFNVSLETLDDVVFGTDGIPLELIQTKHHVDRAADLTDSSVDLWKTIRIWSTAKKDGTLDQKTVFFLVTTASAARGSAAEYLTLRGRDTSVAVQRLRSTASSTSNVTNKSAYEAFRALTDAEQKSLVSQIIVIDNAPNIVALEDALNDLLFIAVEGKYLNAFRDRLEGWWFRRCVRHLMNSDSQPLLSEELEAELTDLREQFKQDNLPIDDDIMDASIDATGYQDRAFVHQLRLIEIGKNRIYTAIQNYFRAFEHRSRWLREELVGVGELTRYENRLVEEWQVHFERMRENLGSAIADEAMKRAAKELYDWIETSHFPIRARVNAPSITRGSYHILSDKLRVGWHPEFRERIQALLDQQEVQQ